jgi:nanoRNase/pAp phosphatase (c-di-AMP/oligoRNAs hydrolase)
MPPMSADKLARALAAGGRDDAAAAVLRIAALEAEDARAPGRLAALSRELDEQVARACRL